MKINDTLKDRRFWILVCLCILSLFLFLGQTQFNTRGEPREALVSMAMLQEGNWILPITNGVDIAYKPPMFHWVIAFISSIIGEISVYTSRMPSALALAFMVLGGFLFYAKRRGYEVAFLTSLITLTNFEIHRAGTNCRVDMLLSALMVLSLYQLYKWIEKKMVGIPWLAILFMSCSFLTKGPVGLVLPCLVMAVFALLRDMNIFRVFFSFIGISISACILPALWYFAAWKQGGDSFLNLVMEENVLRFLGKMSYTSHENPWYYNVMTVITGFLPYTLLLFIPIAHFKKRFSSFSPVKVWPEKFKNYIKNMDDARLFSLLSIVIIFVFYCIPKSKRSVYLLPIYPFISYFIAEYILYLVKNKPHIINNFNKILASLGIILTLVFFFIQSGMVPHSIFHGRHAYDNIAFLQGLENIPLGINLVIVLLPLLIGVVYFFVHKNNRILTLGGGMIALSLFFTLDGVYLPAILNTKSNKIIADQIISLDPEAKVYSFITQTEIRNRMHPFTINFYLKGTVVPFRENQPKEGFLLLGENEYDNFLKEYGKDYSLTEIPNSRYKSCDDRNMTRVYTFKNIVKE